MRTKHSIVLFVVLIGLVMVGCEIEETKTNQGRIYVELRDSNGDMIAGARISLDGVQTPQTTPDTLKQVPIGPHTVSASKPGYEPASLDVTVQDDQTSIASMTAADAQIGTVEFPDAPDGAVILVNNTQFAIVPPRLLEMGVGSWNMSAYLEGNATNAPARWTVNVSPHDTARVDAGFSPLTVGSSMGFLAPVFTLPSDLDSAMFRLQDYRGKIVLVSFFFYTCAPCLAEFPHIQAVYSDPAYAGWLEFFGLDATDPWAFFSIYRNTHADLGLTFPLLWDQQQTTRTIHYSVTSCPSNFLIDPSGVIRYRWLGVTEGELRGAIESLIAEFGTQN